MSGTFSFSLTHGIRIAQGSQATSGLCNGKPILELLVDDPRDLNSGAGKDAAPERRRFLSATSTLVMAGGLAGGYGTFFAMAGRYFFPSGSNKAWMFVTAAEGVEPGASIAFESPLGVRVVITRQSDVEEGSPVADSFLALSSICPHLGCRVHWEPHNDRFFCPCHNGVFDPSGAATGGPPAADGQDLPRYPLQVIDGALYIEMPFKSV